MNEAIALNHQTSNLETVTREEVSQRAPPQNKPTHSLPSSDTDLSNLGILAVFHHPCLRISACGKKALSTLTALASIYVESVPYFSSGSTSKIEDTYLQIHLLPLSSQHQPFNLPPTITQLHEKLMHRRPMLTRSKLDIEAGFEASPPFALLEFSAGREAESAMVFLNVESPTAV